jgi:hypothetical protein
MKTLTIVYTSLLITFLTGCCSVPGQSGIDCSDYAHCNRLALELNLDSTQSGFKLHEADSTYLIVFNSLGFKEPSDTIWLDRFAFIQQDYKTQYEFGQILINNPTDYLELSSYIIKNKYGSNELRIDSLVMQIVPNNSKCCKEFSGQTPKSFYINGNKIEHQSIVTLSKN